jgi:hypothetical protein
MYNKRKRIISNNYVMIEKENNSNSDKKPLFENLEYEHRAVAEEMLGRRLKEGEEVHHLDENRSNNSPDNLLVLSGPMHVKLHAWLNKNVVSPKPEYEKRISLGCVRCLLCEKPIDGDRTFCSLEHSTEHSIKNEKRYEHPTKEALEKLVWQKPTTKIAESFGVSDKAIEKLCKKLDVEKPPRGFWTKNKYIES